MVTEHFTNLGWWHYKWAQLLCYFKLQLSFTYEERASHGPYIRLFHCFLRAPIALQHRTRVCPRITNDEIRTQDELFGGRQKIGLRNKNLDREIVLSGERYTASYIIA